MTINKQGGKKHKSGKRSMINQSGRKLELKVKGQNYAKVLKMLGNRHIKILTNDGEEMVAHIPGKFKSKGPNHINRDDIILVTERGYQTDKCDVIYIYLPDEVKKMHKMGELNDKLMEKTGEETEDDVVKWESDDDDDEIVYENIQPKRDFDFIQDIEVDENTLDNL